MYMGRAHLKREIDTIASLNLNENKNKNVKQKHNNYHKTIAGCLFTTTQPEFQAIS